MDKSTIDEINKKCPYGQGIFFQPSGIPTDIKELVIYSRYTTGGVTGGSCWGDSNLRPYTCEPDKEHMAVLDIVLEALKPDIRYLDAVKLRRMTSNNNQTKSDDYYGNYSEYYIEWISLAVVEEFVSNLNY